MKNTRRGFLRGLGQTGAAAAIAAVGVATAAKAEPVAELPVAVPPVASAPPQGADIVWPCKNCEHENRTLAMVWDAVKFNLRCRECGSMQMYLWHLKKFDPHPTDYSTAKPLSPRQIVSDRPRPLGE